MNIQMVDLKSQYAKIKEEIDSAVQGVIERGTFINGPQVGSFASELEGFLKVKHVIPCANGTDALQIAIMALNLKKGDEVIVPCFTYIAAVEVIALLGLTPVFVDVDHDTFNINLAKVRKAITPKTRAIIPVHLFGQSADMLGLKEITINNDITIIEDNAQSLGSFYNDANGNTTAVGSLGDIACTSFFPSKNLGCYGDGGALYTNNEHLATYAKKIANHGQTKKYHHEIVGINSRLDSIQAAILSVKLKYLSRYIESRQKVANYYDEHLSDVEWLITPARNTYSAHVYHQYTIKLVHERDRDYLKAHLASKGVPSMTYYPIPAHQQLAFASQRYHAEDFPVTRSLCQTVLSLPIHTEMSQSELNYIVDSIKSFRK